MLRTSMTVHMNESAAMKRQSEFECSVAEIRRGASSADYNLSAEFAVNDIAVECFVLFSSSYTCEVETGDPQQREG